MYINFRGIVAAKMVAILQTAISYAFLLKENPDILGKSSMKFTPAKGPIDQKSALISAMI